MCIRKRPLSGRETASGEKDIVASSGRAGDNNLHVMEYKKRLDLTEYVERHEFAFDEVLEESVSNSHVYDRTTREVVDYAFASGGKATVFAYGQTGAGKTYTV